MKKKSESKKKLTVVLSFSLLVVVAVLLYIIVPELDVFCFNDKAVLHYYNDNQSTGYLSTLYEDKIYYFSNEQNGVNGIYRMDADGSDAEILIECADVRRITVNEDGLCFVGLYLTYNESLDVESTRYGLFESEDFRTAKRKSEELITVYDFFLFENGFSSVSERYIDWKVYKGTSYILQGEEILEPLATDLTTHEIYTEDGRSLLLTVKQYKDIPVYFIAGESYYSYDFEEGIDDYGLVAISETDSGETLSYNVLDYYNLRYLEEKNKIIYGQMSNFYVINLENYSVEREIELTFDDPDYAKYSEYTITGVNDSEIYVKAVIKSGFYDIEEIKYLKINWAEGKYEEILSIDNDSRSVLYFDQEQIIIKKYNRIYKYTVDGGAISQPEFFAKIKEKELDVAKAGDWLFLYSVDGMQTRLLYKINVKTGKTIENTAPFDSSQHDEIHIDEDAPEYYGRN